MWFSQTDCISYADMHVHVKTTTASTAIISPSTFQITQSHNHMLT